MASRVTAATCFDGCVLDRPTDDYIQKLENIWETSLAINDDEDRHGIWGLEDEDKEHLDRILDIATKPSYAGVITAVSVRLDLPSYAGAITAVLVTLHWPPYTGIITAVSHSRLNIAPAILRWC
ncbi:hypothetical protein JB92DRAFT_2831942 [Gautieria morchelliformis]|nr:hypothetical protein JB92DRAFT_2831942 [Gautieria morchelliformis]